MTDKKKSVKGYLQLAGSIVAIWCLTFVVLPAITNSSESFKTVADFIDSAEIDTGQFYYTDVEEVTRANMALRSTIEYFPLKRVN